MTVRETIKELEKFNDDDIVTIGTSKEGWTNIETIEQDGCCVAITEEKTRPFTSDN